MPVDVSSRAIEVFQPRWRRCETVAIGNSEFFGHEDLLISGFQLMNGFGTRLHGTLKNI